MATFKKIRSYLKSCADAFNCTPGYPLADRILSVVFSTYPRNDSSEFVLHKVALLNSLYRTQIFDVYKMAEHVLEQRIDTHLRKGDRRAVALLRRGHGIGTANGGSERDFYSFATKYCHWHRPGVYPMYDYYVAVALRSLNSSLQFRPIFSLEQLRDYNFFLDVLDACRAGLQLDWPGYKRLDQALWIFGQIVDEEADRAIMRVVGRIPKGIY